MVSYGWWNHGTRKDQVMAVYNWYPGHMAKAKRAMTEDIKLIDIIVEIVDARAPFSTRNPDIENLGQGKERIIVLNKADLADDDVTEKWVEHFREDGIRAIALNSKDKQSFFAVRRVIDEAAAKKKEKDLKRGIKNRPVRLLVAGIPNVGKSTFINSLCKKNVAKTGNKPGVTKGKQWISISRGVDLMDTPGILWPRIEDRESQKNLALIGSMNDDAINRNELMEDLRVVLMAKASSLVNEKYGVSEEDDCMGMIEKTAVSQSMLRTGGEPDTDRAAGYLLTLFRQGGLGRITLEEP